MIVTISAILILIVFSAFFSGSETALTAASRPYMHQMAQTSRRARLVNQLHEHKSRLISAILLGNNLVNILASALATGLLIEWFGNAGIAMATVMMTLLILVFAEVLPKTYAFRNANRMALWVAPAIQAVVFLLTPFVRAILFVVRGVLKPFGIDLHADEALGADEDELRGAIELHAGDDETVRHERAMLRSILDLDDVQVGEVMIHRRKVLALDADAPAEETVAAVLASPYTRIPLWRGSPDNIVGLLHVKALLREVQSREAKLEDLDIAALATPPWFIPEYTTLLEQLLAFRERREHFALVVDEYGGLMGIVTLEDILEEIVGDIDDEHDIAVTGIRPQPDGSYIIDGGVTIRDVNRELEWNLPDEEAVTVAGLVLHRTERIPGVGQTFLINDLRFEILRRQRHRIAAVRVTPPETQPEAAETETIPDGPSTDR